MSGPLGSEYLRWVKTRQPGRFNLAASGVLPCELPDLRAGLGGIEINGPGLYGFVPLREAISEHCRVHVDAVVSASGTSMANFIAMAVLIQPGDEVLIEQPVYEPILAAARYFGASVKRFPRDGRVSDFATARTRLIVITNLHNPTCCGFGERDLEDISEAALRAGAKVLVDEVYLECLYGGQSSAIHRGSHFICTGSLTKAYGVGGLRCGWILAEPALAGRMWQFKDLIDASSPHAVEQLSVLAFPEPRSPETACSSVAGYQSCTACRLHQSLSSTRSRRAAVWYLCLPQAEGG